VHTRRSSTVLQGEAYGSTCQSQCAQGCMIPFHVDTNVCICSLHAVCFTVTSTHAACVAAATQQAEQLDEHHVTHTYLESTLKLTVCHCCMMYRFPEALRVQHLHHALAPATLVYMPSSQHTDLNTIENSTLFCRSTCSSQTTWKRCPATSDAGWARRTLRVRRASSATGVSLSSARIQPASRTLAALATSAR
jgi:hypothetical protein